MLLDLLKNTKIGVAQIDPNGMCNAKCWYCPNCYYSIPEDEKIHMPTVLFEKIIEELVFERGGLVSEAFDFIYTSHYNEILLYKYFSEMLEILRKYKIKTMILSNGIALTKKKADIIADYKDVVVGTCLNIPAFGSAKWSSYVNTKESNFEFLIENIKYLSSVIPNLSIQVNGQNPQEVTEQVSIAKSLFPGVNIFPAIGLSDRAGLLHDIGVISNREEIERNRRKEIVNCKNTFSGVGGRPYGWLHVSPSGKPILCCNDFYMEYSFGDLNSQSLRDVWLSDRHAEVIEQAFNNICKVCSMAVWK